jgi:putative hydrolase of the HAD superfamily
MAQSGREPAAILLDCLGTLVALEPPAPLLVVELGARAGIAVTESQAERAIAAEIAYYRAHLDEGRDPESLAGLRLRCAEALRGALPDAVASGADVELVREALLASLRFTPYPDVEPALEAIRGQGVGLVVVSNWDVSLHDLLQRLALAPLFDGIVTSAEAGVRKPAAAIFQRALAVVGASAGDTIHVGDSLEEDVGGALATGIEPVLISRDGSLAPAGVRVIRSLLEL